MVFYLHEILSMSLLMQSLKNQCIFHHSEVFNATTGPQRLITAFKNEQEVGTCAGRDHLGPALFLLNGQQGCMFLCIFLPSNWNIHQLTNAVSKTEGSCQLIGSVYVWGSSKVSDQLPRHHNITSNDQE